MPPTLRHRQSESLSPRQLFQRQVRGLSHDDVNRGHHRNKSISLKYNPYELQHVSSLRVQQHNIRSSSQSPSRTRVPALRQVQEEPDFVLEERQAWSRRSPNTKSYTAPRQQSKPFLIYSDLESEDESSSGHQLRSFAPLQAPADVDDRPRTSRGLPSESVPAITSTDEYTVEISPARSKFMEGSMNHRSQGVASSWVDHATDYETSASETEDDSTPKASEKRRSSSFDIRDFDPPSASSATVKRTLFRRKDSRRCLDDGLNQKEKKKKSKESDEKKSKKRLRKSLSSWSLHGLGEKMGIFNSSSSSVNNVNTETTSEDVECQKAILDERKRKAEVAYAQQFGSKKQKYNSGTAAKVSITDIDADKFATIRHLPPIQDPNATIKARSGTRARRTSLKPSDLTSVFRPADSVDHDARKRPTRRELEKENQQLREMLRRSHSGHTSQDSLRTQYSQPQSQTTAMAEQPERLAIDGNGKIVPPPRLSSNRKSIENLSKAHSQRVMSVDCPNHQSLSKGPNNLDPDVLRRKRLSLDLSPRPSLPELPRSVDMIVEDPEGEESDGEKQKSVLTRTLSQSSRVTRRRHSMHSGDPQKAALPLGKENSRPVLSATVPSIMVSTATDGSHELKAGWQGWDDDVF